MTFGSYQRSAADLSTDVAFTSKRYRRFITPPAGVEPPLYSGLITYTNNGPNTSSVIANPVVYPPWTTPDGGTTYVVNASPIWRAFGDFGDLTALVNQGSPSGPYLVTRSTSDPGAFNEGVTFYEIETDAPQVEFLYLSAYAGKLQILIDGAPLTADAVSLTPTGGNLWRALIDFRIGAVAPPTATVNLGGSLTIGVARNYRVTAVDAAGGETLLSNVATATPITMMQSVQVSWTAVTNAVSYNVYLGNTGFPLFLVNVTTPVWNDDGTRTPGASYVVPTSGRRTRRITYATSFVQMGGIVVGVLDSIRPSPPKSTRGIIFGDSITQGTGSPGNQSSFAQFALRELGCDDPINSGRGGTGYLAVNSGQSTGTLRSRVVADVIARNPTILIVAGGRNDNAFAAAAVQAEATLLFAQLKAALPNTRMAALGPFWGPTVSAPLQAATAAAIQSACTATGMDYIDNAGWVTGTGYAGAVTTDGNSSAITGTDGTHPTLYGHRFYGHAVAGGMAAKLPA